LHYLLSNSEAFTVCEPLFIQAALSPNTHVTHQSIVPLVTSALQTRVAPLKNGQTGLFNEHLNCAMLLDDVALLPVLIALAISIALKFLFYKDASKLRR
jgi:hypothetical protein